ncbi:MAG TPA: nitroreductase family protein [Methanomassiliicoccales archaeon]|jgi:nitroreductase
MTITFTDEEQNSVLDLLIGSRHTIRKLKAEAPPRPFIEEVLKAGLLAPYAQICVTREDFRRFIVIPRESPATALTSMLIKRKASAMYEEYDRIPMDDPRKGMGAKYFGFLKLIGQQGLPALGKAPYYVIVAEQKGIPEVALQSIAHCLQNMWLKATALGLGMQLLSITERMAEDKEFCELIGIPYGEYVLDGFLIGFPDAPPVPAKRPSLNEITRWL